MNRHHRVLTGMAAAALVALVILPASIAWSAATWVEIRAPFTGYWDRWAYAPPCCHLGSGYGDWATDYYQTPYTTGYWYAYSSSSVNSFVTAQVVLKGNTCPLQASSWSYAGIKYRIEVTNDSGDLGFFEYDHVDPDGGSYFIVQGSYVTQGMKIGRTYLWNGGVELPGCWEVTNNNGVHWHIVGYNNTAFSCYPPHAAGTFLTKQAGLLGVVGSNATYRGAPCWSP
jgi:hypothetical protein